MVTRWTARLRLVRLILIGSFLAGCGGVTNATEPASVPARVNPTFIPSSSPAAPTDTPQPMLDSIARTYGFPAEIDPAARYLFYLHGRIVEDQGVPAISPEYGEYEYEAILEALADYGFVVISEQRPRNADGWEYARRGVGQIADLLSAGVAPGRITVVGASKGAAIAAAISYLVRNPEVNYVLLGTCHPTTIDEWIQQELTFSGNVLAIYDVADDEYSGSCEELFTRSEGRGLGRHSELVLQVGTGHGILYQPLDEWVGPTVDWAMQDR